MLPELTSYILSKWDEFSPSSETPRRMNYLGISGSIEGGTTTFLGFVDKRRRPAFVVKIHRNLDETDEVFNERDMLIYLHSRGGSLSASVPRLIFCEKIANVWVLVQSVLDGRPMMAAMTTKGLPELENAEANMMIAKKWLVEFNLATMESIASIPASLKEHGLKQIEEFQKIFDLAKTEREYLNEIADTIAALTNQKIDLFARHGDFCRHNILVSQDSNETRIGVIDWTFCKRAAFPLHDLLFFITAYFLQMRKYHGIMGFTKAFEDTFFNKNVYSDFVKQCLMKYCQDLGIDLSLVRSLFAMFLVERAVFEYQQLVKCSRRGELPRLTIYLAALQNKSYQEAIKEQLWIYFFHIFVREQHRLII